MSNARVLIHYSPRLYSELFSSVLQSICGIEIIRPEPDSPTTGEDRKNGQQIDVIILSLDEKQPPILDYLPCQPEKSKVLAFSPNGNYGFRRMPHCDRWEEISPFGLDQLIQEMI